MAPSVREVIVVLNKADRRSEVERAEVGRFTDRVRCTAKPSNASWN
jgi:hypothetical protein